MKPVFYAPEFAKKSILNLLAGTNFTWDDVIANTNRPNDVACVEAKFGQLIPADQPVTIISSSAYQVFSHLYSSARIYFQVLPDGKGCIVIDADQLDKITRADLQIAQRLVDLSDRGDFSVDGEEYNDITFTYLGKVFSFPDIIDSATSIFTAHLELVDDPAIVNAIGKYIQPWYRDAADHVANETGELDPEYEMVKQYVA